MAIWNWNRDAKNEDLFKIFNKEEKKINFFDFEKKDVYQVKIENFLRLFYKKNSFDFLLKKENQEFLFFIIFFDFGESSKFVEKSNIKIDKNSIKIESSLEKTKKQKESVILLKEEGVKYIYNHLGTHSNSSFDTSSKNTIYYKNKIEKNVGFSSLKITRTPFYLASINASKIPLIKAFTSRVGDTNILDFLVDDKNQDEVFIDLFKNNFGIEFYKDLKKEYNKFVNGSYNESEVTGVEKQILIPDEDSENGYVSISPMSSHNIGFFLNPLLYERNKLLNANMKLIGGTQPQNTSYVNSLLGGKLINFKMSFPQNQKSEVDYLLFNINKRNAMSLDLGRDLNKMNSLLEKDEIPNNKKDIIRDNFIGLFVDEFLESLLVLNNQKDKIVNQNFLKFISFEMNYNEIRNYSKILVENSIYPKKYKKELTKELRNDIVDKICKELGEFNE